ncbi:MAG: helix-turn-helix transcriptional regulator [Longimicrobiales bacterium]
MIKTHWLDELLLLPPLERWLGGTIRAAADELLAPGNRIRDLVDAAKDRIEDRLHDVTVAELWRDSDLSRTAFTRAFSRIEGQPPREYLQERRIERAKRLLRSDRPLTDIALALGFYDQSHFTRVFKHWTGETPAAFRRRTNVQDGPDPG